MTPNSVVIINGDTDKKFKTKSEIVKANFIVNDKGKSFNRLWNKTLKAKYVKNIFI